MARLQFGRMRTVVLFWAFLALFCGCTGVQLTECPAGEVLLQVNRTITFTCEDVDPTLDVDWFIYKINGTTSKVWYTGTCSAIRWGFSSGCTKDDQGLNVTLARPYPPGDKSILIISKAPSSLDGYTVRCSVTPPMSPIQSSCTLRLTESPVSSPISRPSVQASSTSAPTPVTAKATTATTTTTKIGTTTPTATERTTTPTTTPTTTIQTSPTTTTPTTTERSTSPTTSAAKTTETTTIISTPKPTTTTETSTAVSTQTPPTSPTQRNTPTTALPRETTTSSPTTTASTFESTSSPTSTLFTKDTSLKPVELLSSYATSSNHQTPGTVTGESTTVLGQSTESTTSIPATFTETDTTASESGEGRTAEAGEGTTSALPDGHIPSTKAGIPHDSVDDIPVGAIAGGAAAAVLLAAVLVVMCCCIRKGKVRKSSFRKMQYDSKKGAVQAVSELYYASIQRDWDTKVYIPTTNYTLPEIAYKEFCMDASLDNPAYEATYEGGLEPAKYMYAADAV